MTAPLLKVQNISKSFTLSGGLFSAKQTLRAVNQVSFTLNKNQTLALVGESGCGKSTLGKMLALLTSQSSGTIEIEGQKTTGNLKPLRQKVQMVFQDPFSSLNPRMKVGNIIGEPLLVQGKPASTEQVKELAQSVGLNSGDLSRYPHQFSGGQRQRIAIARALSLKPSFLIADEPTSALDVSIQSQILNLMKELQSKHQLAYLFISHDLAVVSHMADHIAVMYLGEIVEIGPKKDVLQKPAHPYTQSLLAAVPKLGKGKRQPQTSLIGEPPSPLAPPLGCAFHSRCPLAEERCKREAPALKPYGPDRQVACYLKSGGAP
ncbi:MAG: ATP-binding cassette domain-containing protein [Alphaproteobacteria bacterium]|nr:ATP-binding cassette domain-containing protein [Rhodospirillales bacterium]MCW9044846.1 ATP-binding cassette domain-containing protein [Alphaproteobacteria bacterium]